MLTRIADWFRCTFGTPRDTQLGYSVPVGVQVEPIGEANVGGINNRNYGACVATPYATDGLCLTLPPMSMEQAEYMFGYGNIKES